MTVNVVSRGWLLGGWLAVVGVTVASSVAMEARLSTSALLFLIAVAPAAVMVLVGAGRAPSPTVAEILHPANGGNGRS